MKPAAFIVLVAPAAQASAAVSGVPASFTVAQAALESGWGESQLTRQAKNPFGVKAGRSWTGEVWTRNTREYLRGAWVMVPARWRKYPDWQSCIDDHAAFLRDNPRYSQCFAHRDGEGFARAVAAAGYATDPDYADKLVAIMRRHRLSRLDAAPAKETA